MNVERSSFFIKLKGSRTSPGLTVSRTHLSRRFFKIFIFWFFHETDFIHLPWEEYGNRKVVALNAVVQILFRHSFELSFLWQTLRLHFAHSIMNIRPSRLCHIRLDFVHVYISDMQSHIFVHDRFDIVEWIDGNSIAELNSMRSTFNHEHSSEKTLPCAIRFSSCRHFRHAVTHIC